MPNIGPANSKKDPKKRFGWKKFNKYYDEYTIRFRNGFINIDPKRVTHTASKTVKYY